MRIIINADDLGSSPAVNRSVFSLLSRRRITSSTILANGPAFPEAVAGAKEYPRASFGVHLNITEYPPLTSHPAFQGFLDSGGRFRGMPPAHRRFSRRLREAVYLEWSAQIERVLSHGIPVSHMDSHHDMHRNPALFWVLKRLQWTFGIRKVRIAENISPDPRRRYFRNRLWNLALRACVPTKTTAGFTSLSTFLRIAGKRPLPGTSLELMVHPGHPGFHEDQNLLESPWEKGIPFPVEWISYHDL